MLKKLLLISLLIISNFSFVELSYGANGPTRPVGDPSVKDTLLNYTEGGIVSSNSNDGLQVIADIFKWIKDTLTSLIMLIGVGVFLFIGIRLMFARGNPEEFKKAMMHLVYAVIGIFLVSLAWAAVVLVAGLKF